jgi:hypothetical protein
MEKCVKYRNGIPTQCWIITILSRIQNQVIVLGFSPDFETSILPAICIQSDIELKKIVSVFRQNQIGILRTLTIGHLHYVYFLVNSTEN